MVNQMRFLRSSALAKAAKFRLEASCSAAEAMPDSPPEHDAEKSGAVSDYILLYFIDFRVTLDAHSLRRQRVTESSRDKLRTLNMQAAALTPAAHSI
ncbi:hypothetical protein ACVOMV_35960 [Mesorhizobium atlanticum]